jgi:hypothetical protein
MAMITRFLTGLANGKCVKVVIIKTGLTSVYDCISLYVETDLTCGPVRNLVIIAMGKL